MKRELIDDEALQKSADLDLSAVEDFYLNFGEEVSNIAKKYARNTEDAKDLKQEAFLKLLKKLGDVKNPGPWIARVTKYLGLDYLKGIKNEQQKSDAYSELIFNIKSLNKQLIYVPNMKKCKSYQPELRYIEKELKMLPEIEKLKIIKPQFLKGLEKSLKYIHWIYYLKEQHDNKQEYVIPFMDMRANLDKIKNEFKNKYGPPSEEEVMKLYKTIKPKFSKEDRRHMDEIFREPIHYLMKLHFLKGPFMRDHKEKVDKVIGQHGFNTKKILEATAFPEKLHRSLDRLYTWADNKELYDRWCQRLSEQIKEIDEVIQGISSIEWYLLPHEFKNQLGNIDKLNIDPPILIFRVWTQAFRKKKKTNLKLVRSLLLEFKKISKKTYYNSLFENLDESMNVETWRKKIYKSSANKKYYDDLSDLIYKMSFLNNQEK